jgi:DNA-binding transcriptional LysR family regulator
MNWTIEQLKTFVTAVKCGSFSAGARHLGKAQSRVSTAISNLETDFGFELFDRSKRLPRLTERGEELYIEALAVLEQCERLNSRALTVSAGQELSLVVAIDEAVPINAFEEFFVSLAQQFPLFKLTLIHGSQQDIANWVEQGKADFGILFYYLQDLPEILEFKSLSEFHQILIVSHSHPLACINNPTITQLNQYRQLVICDRLGTSREKPISSNHWHLDSYFYIAGLVARNVGWAMIPEHVARSDWYEGQLKELSTENIAATLLVEMGMVKRRDKGVGPIMEWIGDQLVDLFKGLKKT